MNHKFPKIFFVINLPRVMREVTSGYSPIPHWRKLEEKKMIGAAKRMCLEINQERPKFMNLKDDVKNNNNKNS